MAAKDTAMSGEGLIKADNLPDSLLRSLTYEEIQQVGCFLFSQLVKQRDVSLKAGVRKVVDWIEVKGYLHPVLPNVWQAQLEEWGLACTRCGAVRTDNVGSDVCGTCADDLRQERESR